MQHPDEGTIHSWLDGALSPEEAARMEAHVNECPQCAAAVAEARGFIAASSRILTALDNVPTGVVPAGSGKRETGSGKREAGSGTREAAGGVVARSPMTRNWMYWRAAAAVLVIAIGTVVVRREESNTSQNYAIIETADTNPVAKFAVPETVLARKSVPPSVAQGAVTRGMQSAPPRAQPNGRIEPSVAGGKAGAPEISRSKIGVADATRPRGESEASRPRIEAGPGTAGGTTSSLLAASKPSVTTSPNAPLNGILPDVHGVTISGVTSGVVVFGQPEVRALSSRRVIGANRSVYEVAPGDTVVLTEALPVQFDQVVVTGAAAARPVATTSMATATARANAQTPQSAPPASANAQTSQPAPAATADTLSSRPAPPKGAAKQDAPSGVNTIAWTDSKTGHAMQLSGHHTPEELQAIRQKIESARAAESAAKKTP
ncbi:MAG: zf-HC2 domain-containing protein [Gemmatimonadaceae bacterium]